MFDDGLNFGREERDWCCFQGKVQNVLFKVRKYFGGMNFSVLCLVSCVEYNRY